MEGSPKKGYIYLNKPSDKYRLAQQLNLKPSIDHLKFNQNDVLDSFKSSLVLAYHDGDIKILLNWILIINYTIY